MHYAYIISVNRSIKFKQYSMNNDIQEATNSIISEQKMIQQNRQHRNQIYQNCIDSYLNHLKIETNQLESTEALNDERNKQISSAFENVYDQIVTSSHVTLRKIKQTSFEKKLFWENLIKNNAAMSDIELKKEFYQQKRDAEDRYYDAIDQQKSKKIPYSVLLGKNKKSQQLRQWQENNRVFEEKVNKGTATLNQWQHSLQKNTNFSSTQNPYGRDINQMSEQQLNSGYLRTDGVQSRGDTLKAASPTNYQQQWNNRDDIDFLKNFQKKK